MRFAFAITLVMVSVYFGSDGTRGEVVSSNSPSFEAPRDYAGSTATLAASPLGQGEETPSPQSIVPGSVGSTRNDALSAWKISEDAEPVFSTVNARGQMIIYDTDDMRYQVTFIFEVQDDDVPRLTDRTLMVSVGLVKYETVDRGVAQLDTLLPEDAEPIGTPMENNIGDRVRVFKSQAVADALPHIEENGDAEPGMIWLTVGMVGDKVGAIEISALDPGGLSPIED